MFLEFQIILGHLARNIPLFVCTQWGLRSVWVMTAGACRPFWVCWVILSRDRVSPFVFIGHKLVTMLLCISKYNKYDFSFVLVNENSYFVFKSHFLRVSSLTAIISGMLGKLTVGSSLNCMPHSLTLNVVASWSLQR